MWILCDNQWWPVQWLDWEEASKHFPKPNLHQKKVTVTVWCSAVGLIHYSFLNPSKTITTEKYVQPIHEMHEKLQSLQPALLNRKVPILLHNTWLHQHQQTFVCSTNKTKLWSFASSAISNWLPLLQASQQFFAGKRFHNEQEAENAFQEFIESKSMDFCAIGINTYWQKWVDCNGSYVDE